MSKDLILALDQSTSGSKAMIIDNKGNVLVSSQKSHKQYYPKPGWVEHDPEEIYENSVEILKKVIRKVNTESKNIKVLSLTNQRETVLVWDKKTGKPVYPAIVWQCRRTSEICKKLKDQDFEKCIKDKTGLLLDPYFSASKIKWIIENIDDLKSKSKKGELLLGTIDTWLIWRFTGGKIHATDYTNASRTMLFNIKTLEWDLELLDIFGIEFNMLPQIKFSDEIFGSTVRGILYEYEIPISGVIGDSQGALFGQNCFESGMIKATYGTGTSVMMYTGNKFVNSEGGLAISIAWGRKKRVDYATEGIIISTGDALNWLKDNIGLFEDFKQIDSMAESPTDNEGVYMIPAFSGMGAPYWNMEARAAIIGLSRKSNKNNLVRSALEAVAYQVRDAIELMKNESGIQPLILNADGGLTQSRFLMQFQADMLDFPIAISSQEDLSLMGSAYIAGLAIGIWEDTEQIKQIKKKNMIFEPKIEKKLRDNYYNNWKESVNTILNSTIKK